MEKYVVRTTDGALHTAGHGGGKTIAPVPLSKVEAKYVCDQANKMAKALGIKTRYEVVAE